MTKILVVEDDKIIQTLLMHRLRAADYDVIIASNGVEGVNVAQAEAPDLILIDMRMPFLNGWRATRQLKTTADTSHIPIIAVSAQTLTDDRRRCFEAGCDDFFAKPIQFVELFDRIEGLLGEGQVVK